MVYEILYVLYVQELEDKVREDEKNHWARVAMLIQRNKSAATTYKSLDERINLVAGKVVHLGDQLESVNTPRARAEEALKLMKHFDDFLDGDTSVSPVFTEKTRLYEAADIIQKLQLIAQVGNLLLTPFICLFNCNRIESDFSNLKQ